ncbi:SDR family oxidoreductase [Chryseobacterium sp. SIMBA_029]|uniref:SDR family oxidoreductase n=1 Tax=Chryseobacterium sp. SIMBA_029 TaxID=3085772 RepID=UPI00397CC697
MNIIVTGASKGIGYDTVLEFSKNKENKIIAISRNINKLNDLKKVCYEKYNNEIKIIQYDITTSHIENQNLLDILENIEFVDIFINNAGILINKKFIDLTQEDWITTFDINFLAPVNLIRLLYPKLKNSKSAHIINISSMGGIERTQKFSGLSSYSSSKAALVNLTECLAEEFMDDNIHCNCLSLGSVDTEMFRAAFPSYHASVSSEEIAQFICNFSQNYRNLFNGKIIPIAISTP